MRPASIPETCWTTRSIVNDAILVPESPQRGHTAHHVLTTVKVPVQKGRERKLKVGREIWKRIVGRSRAGGGWGSHLFDFLPPSLSFFLPSCNTVHLPCAGLCTKSWHTGGSKTKAVPSGTSKRMGTDNTQINRRNEKGPSRFWHKSGENKNGGMCLECLR